MYHTIFQVSYLSEGQDHQLTCLKMRNALRWIADNLKEMTRKDSIALLAMHLSLMTHCVWRFRPVPTRSL